MFGKNPVMKQELGDGRSLRVVKGSPFYTIQGEGPFAGHPAVFIRLHGCNLRCWFCDTEFSNPDDPEWEMIRLARVAYDNAHAPITNTLRANLVVITGGEPLRQNIVPLCEALLKQGMQVQIETAGSLWVDGLDNLLGPRYGNRMHIVCSPKTAAINPEVFRYATAFKYVVGQATRLKDGHIEASTQIATAAPRWLAAPRPGAPVYLSPMDEYDPGVNADNRRRVGKLCLAYGYIAGVQMHKLMEIDEP